MIKVEVLQTPQLGDRSYIVHDGKAGVIVDPQRDLDWVLETAAQLGVELAYVAETHIHNDYVSGGLALSRRLGADYLVAAADEVEFNRRPITDGQEVEVGSFSLRAVATPGHTPNHLAYLAIDEDVPVAACSGGSLLYGTVGRTDLLGEELTDQLARLQYRSAQQLAALPEQVALYPTHGFGSFCASGPPSQETASTVGRQRLENEALNGIDEEAFVILLRSNARVFPRYYSHAGQQNRLGAPDPDRRLPPILAAAELSARIAAGQWVVDMRDRYSFAANHLAGSIGIEHGDLFSTYLGWLIPWGHQLNLVSGELIVVSAAQRDLTRIGIDRIDGAGAIDLSAISGGDVATGSYRVSNFAGLAAELGLGAASDQTRTGGVVGSAEQRSGQPRDRPVVLDVRRAEEWADGHISGAAHIPIHQLLDRASEVPEGIVWVHCASGFRAAIAASLLDRAGRKVVLVSDDLANARECGLIAPDGTEEAQVGTDVAEVTTGRL